MSPKVSLSLLAVQSDERLVSLARQGHERAFEAVVQRYHQPLLRYCGRMGLSDARAEDILQHSFLQAWLALERGVEVRELRAWLYRIVHNTLVNGLRSPAADHGPLEDGAAGAQHAVSAHSELERRIAVREALTDVAALPQMQREAILMTALDGRSHEEVASMLGVTNGAVRGLLYRARATLRGAAAALTPAPLVGWALGGGGRVKPTAARLAEFSAAGGGDAGATLLKGAVALTAAAVAAGAVVVPLQQNGAPAQARATLIGAPGSSGATALRRASSSSRAALQPQGRGTSAVQLKAGGANHSARAVSPRPSGASSPAGAGAPLALALAPTGAVRTDARGATASGPAQAGSPSGGGGEAPGGSTQPPVTGTGTEPSAPPKPEGGKGSPEPEGARERKEHEEELAREKKEHEAEAAREKKEHEAEAARERKEHEEELAREKKEHEAEAAKEAKERALERAEKEAEVARERREREAEVARELAEKAREKR
jgi:RNA polymerase sigma factor (sigma-70 family)